MVPAFSASKRAVVGERNVVDLVGVAEGGDGDRPAEVDVEAVPGARRIAVGKTRQAFADTADELAAGPHVVERARPRGRRSNDDNGRKNRGPQPEPSHTASPIVEPIRVRHPK